MSKLHAKSRKSVAAIKHKTPTRDKLYRDYKGTRFHHRDVYMRKEEPLPSTQNTEKMKALVLKAARARFHKRYGIKAIFEHGHWWVQVPDANDSVASTGIRTFDVVDAEGPGSIYGLDFEQV